MRKVTEDLTSKSFKDFHAKIIDAVKRFYIDGKPFVIKVKDGEYVVRLKTYKYEEGDVVKANLNFINNEGKEVFLEVFDRDFNKISLDKFLQFAYIVAYVIYHYNKSAGVRNVKIEGIENEREVFISRN